MPCDVDVLELQPGERVPCFSWVEGIDEKTVFRGEVAAEPLVLRTQRVSLVVATFARTGAKTPLGHIEYRGVLENAESATLAPPKILVSFYGPEGRICHGAGMSPPPVPYDVARLNELLPREKRVFWIEVPPDCDATKHVVHAVAYPAEGAVPTEEIPGGLRLVDDQVFQGEPRSASFIADVANETSTPVEWPHLWVHLRDASGAVVGRGMCRGPVRLMPGERGPCHASIRTDLPWATKEVSFTSSHTFAKLARVPVEAKITVPAPEANGRRGQFNVSIEMKSSGPREIVDLHIRATDASGKVVWRESATIPGQYPIPKLGTGFVPAAKPTAATVTVFAYRR